MSNFFLFFSAACRRNGALPRLSAPVPPRGCPRPPLLDALICAGLRRPPPRAAPPARPPPRSFTPSRLPQKRDCSSCLSPCASGRSPTASGRGGALRTLRPPPLSVRSQRRAGPAAPRGEPRAGSAGGDGQPAAGGASRRSGALRLRVLRAAAVSAGERRITKASLRAAAAAAAAQAAVTSGNNAVASPPVRRPLKAHGAPPGPRRRPAG